MISRRCPHELKTHAPPLWLGGARTSVNNARTRNRLQLQDRKRQSNEQVSPSGTSRNHTVRSISIFMRAHYRRGCARNALDKTAQLVDLRSLD
jgi:hypothetical protein